MQHHIQQAILNKQDQLATSHAELSCHTVSTAPLLLTTHPITKPLQPTSALSVRGREPYIQVGKIGMGVQISGVVGEQELGLQQMLHTMGMLDSAYWLSWMLFEVFCMLCMLHTPTCISSLLQPSTCMLLCYRQNRLVMLQSGLWSTCTMSMSV